MDNLQTEVLELEFGEFSHGMKTITEVEFAQILLRYTILTADEHEEYLERLRSKVTDVQVTREREVI
jgi:fructoselysine-6-P-deglycase FrlB-like protein